MEGENFVEILQRYRRDRHVLLDYIISGSLIKKVVMPPGALSLDDVDLDQVSVDYVLNCAKTGGVADIPEAIRDFHAHTGLPFMNKAGSSNSFYLVTNPEVSGLPPRRPPPNSAASSMSKSDQINIPKPESRNTGKLDSSTSTHAHSMSVDDIEDFEDDDDDDAEELKNIRAPRQNLNDVADAVLGLPSFTTGITDDDLRETAYEVLLACAGASGDLIIPPKEKKKRSRLKLKLVRHRSDSTAAQSKCPPGLLGLLETMRGQMEITEAMNIRTRQGLVNALAGNVGRKMDTLLIPLELLCFISQADFSDKKAYIRWQKRQLNMLEEGLINYPAVELERSGDNASELRILLSKIEESESLPPSTGELQRTDCLRKLREIAIPLAERPVQDDLTVVCHWADGYHLNVRLYEKLLFSVFDILDEGNLIEEIEEVLELLKSTWRVLGITQTIHHICYAWVLFNQYGATSEQELLQHVIEQLKKAPVVEQLGPQERLYLNSMHSQVGGQEGYREISFLQTFLLPIHEWADNQLVDYHLHFAEGSRVESVVAIAVVARKLLMEENEAVMQSTASMARDQIESYISSSTRNAYARAVERSGATDEHPLGYLAQETINLLRKDATIFMPVLSRWHPQAIVVSASILHKLYGIKLEPFLDDAEYLTEDVEAVLPVADDLEQCIMSLIMSTSKDGTDDVLDNELMPYQIESTSETLVMRWLNSQLGRILGWIERAIQLEKWEPISSQLQHGSSIVEVYRIVEETVEQFFALKVPMRPTELSSIFAGVDNAFQVFVSNMTEKLVSKDDLIPPVPALTRYSKTAGITGFIRKELFDHRLPDERRSNAINVLTTPTLCVQLNTLYYAFSQLNKLEESILERWAAKKPRKSFINKSMDRSKSFSQKDTFDVSRKHINAAIDRFCEFTGTKIIFWDLRQPFIENLYKPSVPEYRLEALVDSLDVELGQICDIIMEELRDRVVTSLLQASLDGLLRVLLDGGSGRLFNPADATLLEEDLETLKDFFVSGGDGLPVEEVESLAARAQQVIDLQGHETEELIEELKGGGSSGGADSKTLVRILCHRTDSEASKFLKKQFKIPKSYG